MVEKVLAFTGGILKINRTEILVLILLLLVFLVGIAFVFNGFHEPEMILEMRRRTYCFRGHLKSVFCISLLVFLLTLLYVLFLGKKIQISASKRLVIGKGKAIVVSVLFFGSLITIPVSIVFARYSCG